MQVQAQFAAEETPSTRGYPPEYRVKAIEDQASMLRQLFPRLAGDAAATGALVSGAPLPAGAEGWFLVPRWQALASTYNAAVDDVLATIARTRPASLWRSERLGRDRLRQQERTFAMMEKMGGGLADLIPLAAQFGLRHRGRSIRHARESFAEREFGLGIFAVGCMLLTHPERLRQAEQLYVDCAGDEYSASDEQQFSEAPFFRVIDGRVGFGTSWIGYVDPYFGSATAFVP